METKVVVIDGLGGGIGKAIVEKIKRQIPNLQLIAVGTNSYAMQAMKKAGADYVFCGQDELIHHASTADIIVSVIGVLIPNGLAGELTSDMVHAISTSNAIKILIPMNKCGIKIATEDAPLSVHIDSAIDLIKKELNI